MSKKVLVACEESQAVTIALRRVGVVAFSCDTEPCSGGHPEWHIHGPVQSVLTDEWAAIIAFPPCTHLASSGAAWFKEKRADGRQQDAIDFFMLFANHPCGVVAIENPVGIMSSVYRKPDQIIQPWQFGHEARKRTCLWLRGLPLLAPTKIVSEGESVVFVSGKKMPKWYADAWKLSPKERSAIRSKTFQGVADAMAEQWGRYLR